MKALLFDGTVWVKVFVVAWLPGPNDREPSAIYYRDDDKQKTLRCLPLYQNQKPVWRAA